MHMDPYLQRAASAYITRHSCARNQAYEQSSKKSLLSSKAQAFIPSKDNKTFTPSWIVSITPAYSGEQLSLLGDSETAVPNGVMHSSSHDTVDSKDLHSEQPLERVKTGRGGQLLCDTHVPGAQDLPARSLHYHASLDSHVNQVPVKHTFIHFENRSFLDDNDHVSILDAEAHSSTGLTKSSSAPALLMQNPFFESISTVGKEEEEAKIAEDSATPEVQRPLHEMKVDMKLAHARGTCKPCAYFYDKEDGCRLGLDCNFCHLCPPHALRDHRRQKARARRHEKVRRRYEAPRYHDLERAYNYKNRFQWA